MSEENISSVPSFENSVATVAGLLRDAEPVQSPVDQHQEAGEDHSPATETHSEDSPESVEADTVEIPPIGESEEGHSDTKETPSPIAPPTSWTASEKEAFKLLPPEVQKTISERESERRTTIDRQMQEAAEAKRAAVQERQKLITTLETSANILVHEMGKKYGNLIPGSDAFLEFAREYPDKAVLLDAEYKRDVLYYNNMQSEYAQVTQVQQAEKNANYQNWRAGQIKAAQEYFPEMKDPEKGKKLVEDMAKYLKSEGISDEDIKWMSVDHMKIVNDAMKYRKLTKEGQAKRQAVTPQVVKPGASSDAKDTDRSSVDRAKDRFTKSGTFEDAVKLMKHAF